VRTIQRDEGFNPGQIRVLAFTDADWAACRVSRRSLTGYVVYLNNNMLCYANKYHPTQCLSTMEAEYMGQTFTSKALLFIFHFLSEVGFHSNGFIKLVQPIPMFGDNNAALNFAEEQAVNHRTKHIDLRHHFLNTLVENGTIQMNYVCTTDNIADTLTKPLPKLSFDDFTSLLMGNIAAAIKALTTKLLVLNEPRHKLL
jgi:hypothetical protein